MKKFWLALLFLLGDVSHELRSPTSCHTISTRQADWSRKRCGE